MRVAAIYDIHANLPALEAALKDIQDVGVDCVVVGGDVFPGPMPEESLERLLNLDVETRFLIGNGDREVAQQMKRVETEWFASAPEAWRAPVRWTAEALPKNHAATIDSWPSTVTLDVDGVGPTLFCHATPKSDSENFTRLTPEERLLTKFDEVETPLVICGHTHMQFDRMIGKVRVVNAGSVGMPFCEPGAYWLLMDRGVELRRTKFDLEDAAARVRETSYPDVDGFAKNNILNPPSEQVTLEMFSRAETKANE